VNHELPTGWVEVEIGEIATVVGGGTPKANEPDNFLEPGKGTAWLTPADLSGYKQKEIGHGKRDLSEKGLNSSSAVLMPKGALLFSSRAPIGYVAIASNEISTNQGFKSFVFADGVYPSYAFYYLKSIKSMAEERGSGSTFKELSGAAAKKLPFILPPTSEQIGIADKLDRILARVNAAQARLDKIPALIKRFRQSVLAAATSGELTQEWRNSNFFTTNEMLEGYEPLPKPARYQTRNLGFIPGVIATAVGMPDEPPVSAWKWVPLIEVAEMGSGHTPSRSNPEYWDGDICWVGIKDAREHHGRTIYDTIQKTNSLGLENSAARLLPENTICISRTASVGYVVRLGQSMATSQDFVTWTPTEVIDPDWLKWLFVSEREALFKFGRGSTHTTIYFPEWLSLHIALPPLQEQKEIVRRVESLFALADSVEKQYQDAKARSDRLTQAILAKAFRGELVPQDPDDEPAEVLLERIQAQRAAQAAIPKKSKKNAQSRVKSTTTKSGKQSSKGKNLTQPVTSSDDLLSLLKELGDEIDASALWKKSGLSIDDFYALLKRTDQIEDHNPSSDPAQRKLRVRQ
jgi:type I restriction enzyme S subunit